MLKSSVEIWLKRLLVPSFTIYEIMRAVRQEDTLSSSRTTLPRVLPVRFCQLERREDHNHS